MTNPCDVECVKIALLVLAEMIFEGGKQVLCTLMNQILSGPIKALLICACNVEDVVPPFCVVRMRNQARGLKYTLAASLKTEPQESTNPYLLRFAEVDYLQPMKG